MSKTFHCFFEQSGTFKKEFKKLGGIAYDYDIQDEFGETDYVIDLFAEIEKAYEEKESIFDNMKQEDMILAFFPCTRFEDQIQLHFRGCATQYWFINCKPKYNLILEPQIWNERKTINNVHNKTERSLISKEYANRFIREFILEEEESNVK